MTSPVERLRKLRLTGGEIHEAKISITTYSPDMSIAYAQYTKLLTGLAEWLSNDLATYTEGSFQWQVVNRLLEEFREALK